MDRKAEDETPFEAQDALAFDPSHPLSSIVLQIEIMGVLGGWWR